MFRLSLVLNIFCCLKMISVIFVLFIFLKHKSEAVDKLNIFLNLVENQFNRKKFIKSDNGTKIKNARSRDIFEKLRIFHGRSVAYTPEQNGRIEREIRTIIHDKPNWY